MAAKKKQARKPSSNSQKKSQRRKTSGAYRTAAASKQKKKVKKPVQAEPSDLTLVQDLFIILAFAVSVFLFLSSFHLCGSIGEAAYKVQRGLFGVLGYAAPVVLFICLCFLLIGRPTVKNCIRSLMAAFMFTVACGITELMSVSGADAARSLKEYYALAMEQTDGGAVGGFYLKNLFPLFGTIGSYVIMILLFMAAGVIVTQRSVIKPIEDSGKKAYDNAKEDLQERALLRAEQRKIREEAKKAARKAKYEEKLQETRERAEAEVRAREEAKARAREEARMRAEAKAQENAKRAETEREAKAQAVRRGQKVSGINLDALIIDESDQPGVPPVSAAENGNPDKKNTDKKNVVNDIAAAFSIPLKATSGEDPEDDISGVNPADFFVGEIHGMNGNDKTAETPEKGSGAEDTKAGIFDDQPLHAQKVSRASDSAAAKEKPLTMISVARPRTEKAEQASEQPEKSAEETAPAEALTGNDSAENKNSDEISDMIPVNREEKSPVIGAYDAVEPDREVEMIPAAGGKMIARELDPTEEDVIRRKLREQSGEKKASSGTSVFRESGSRSSSGAVRFTEFEPKNKNIHQVVTPAPEVTVPKVKKPERPYIKPPKGLLKAGAKTVRNRDAELRETAVKLQQTLQNFNVGVTVTNISCGPSVTRYELTPEQGVKVSKIVSLQDDIKLSLAAADIRIEAPIPGKSAVGIEVPNKENMTVALRDILDSDEFNRHPSKLAFGVGRDIAGNIVVTDLAKMPHLLIAGATGSGKSVCINTLIMSIIFKADPKEVRLIMVDPKVVELSVYNGIPHLLIPVVTDPKKAAGALNWAVANMTDRYKKFAEKNVRDLRGYNDRLKEEEGEDAELLPQIVIIVDELADLMMVAPGEVEDAICRLAQMARAAGIHLVLATQRPSVNVITGLIKANVPSRIAFSVSSGVDSRTIIDMVGAEKLLGKGDMLFYPSGFQKPARVQGAFVSDEEVSAVVKFLTDRSEVTYSTELENSMAAASGENSGQAGAVDSSHDALFADAGRFIIEKDKASIGMLQRAFKIGFNRAARIMDQLAEAGVVGEEEGTKPRKVLMTRQEFDSQFGGQ